MNDVIRFVEERKIMEAESLTLEEPPLPDPRIVGQDAFDAYEHYRQCFNRMGFPMWFKDWNRARLSGPYPLSQKSVLGFDVSMPLR